MKFLKRLAVYTCLALALSHLSPSRGQQQPEGSRQVDRLLSLCKLWSAVKYFHPYLAYRRDIDWDNGALSNVNWRASEPLIRDVL